MLSLPLYPLMGRMSRDCLEYAGEKRLLYASGGARAIAENRGNLLAIIATQPPVPFFLLCPSTESLSLLESLTPCHTP